MGFVWSHAPLAALDRFLHGVVRRLESGGLVVVVDNRFVDGSNQPITRRGEHGDTYQQRRLDDGSSWEVLKNFPAPDELAATLSAVHRVLRPGGWFVAVVAHPCFLAPHALTTTVEGRPARAVHAYFEDGFWRSGNPHGVRGRAGNHHRSLATYLNALIGAGLRIDAVAEPRATPLLASQQPVYTGVPIFLGLRATTAATKPKRGIGC